MMLHEITQYKTDLEGADEVWNLLNKHCQDALDTLPIIRGMSPFKKGFGIIHGEAGERRSQNTSNHYTVILDEVLPKAFPRRSKSIICTNWANRGYAKGYGHPYAIVPYDGVTIGVCPERDIFETEVKLSKLTDARPIYRWNDFYNTHDISDESYAKFIKDFKYVMQYKDFWDLKAETLEDTIRTGYTKPFKLATTATAEVYNDGGKHELWIGGKCVAIDLALYRSVVNGRKS